MTINVDLAAAGNEVVEAIKAVPAGRYLVLATVRTYNHSGIANRNIDCYLHDSNAVLSAHETSTVPNGGIETMTLIDRLTTAGLNSVVIACASDGNAAGLTAVQSVNLTLIQVGAFG